MHARAVAAAESLLQRNVRAGDMQPWRAHQAAHVGEPIAEPGQANPARPQRIRIDRDRHVETCVGLALPFVDADFVQAAFARAGFQHATQVERVGKVSPAPFLLAQHLVRHALRVLLFDFDRVVRRKNFDGKVGRTLPIRRGTAALRNAIGSDEADVYAADRVGVARETKARFRTYNDPELLIRHVVGEQALEVVDDWHRGRIRRVPSHGPPL